MAPKRMRALTTSERVTATRRYLTKSWFVPCLISSKYFICITPPRSDRERLVELAVPDEPLDDGAGHDDAREHGGEQPDDERGGETAHRSRSVGADDESSHQRRDVPVEDGPEDLVVALLHGCRDR